MPPRTVHIHHGVIADIFTHARAEAPLECCGLVLGQRREPVLATGARPASGAAVASWTLQSVIRARNLLCSPTRYQLDPRDHFAALRTARQRGQAVLAAYHSHPLSIGTPSPRDLAEATDAELLYLIVGLLDGRLRAFCLDERNFQPVALVPLS